MKKYFKTAVLSSQQKTNGGVIYLFPDILIKITTLVPLVFLWRVIISSGSDVGMSLGQMLTYTYVSALLSDLLVVTTPASGWLSEGILLKLYGRPLPVINQLAAQTVGGWLPMLMLFSVPMALIAPLFGISLLPASPFFPLSLALCVLLGFAVDLLFSCLSIKLRNMNWLISRMRMAITTILSGTIIPIMLLPFGMARIVKYQPFASLGGAALSVFVGIADVKETIILQIFWNLIAWPIALLVWKKSQEGMVSYGG